MPYRAEDGDSLLFEFSSPASYTPDAGDGVYFDYIPNVNVPVNHITSLVDQKHANISPGLGIAPLNVVTAAYNVINDSVLPGSSNFDVSPISSLLSIQDIIIGRGSIANLISANLNTPPINISTGPISFSVDYIPFTSTKRDIRSTICFSVNLLTVGSDIYDSDVSPGGVSSVLDAIDANIIGRDIDGVYIPKKGLGVVNIQPYFSENVDDSSTNGGAISFRRVKDNFKGLFSYIDEEKRINGCTLYRKLFWRNNSLGKANLLDGVIYIDKYNNNDAIFTIWKSNYYDIQYNITGNERQYGTGLLNSPVSIDDTVIILQLKRADLYTFFSGDTIILKNNKGESERFDNISVIQVDDIVTITLPSPVQYSYSVGDLCSSCININTVSNYTPKVAVEISLNGVFNKNFPVECYGNGVIKDDWTITFTSNTDYTCSNYSNDKVFEGNIYYDLAPINPITGTAYFIIDHRAFNSLFISGDILKFSTRPVCVPIWVKLVIPPNSVNNIVNRFSCAIQGTV